MCCTVMVSACIIKVKKTWNYLQLALSSSNTAAGQRSIEVDRAFNKVLSCLFFINPIDSKCKQD
jgi:hypothetical protein